MTGLTHIGCQRVGWAFTRCIDAVVATETVVSDIGVIEVCRCPGHGRVAIVAVIAARDMPRVLAVRDRAVVAGDAGTEYLCVIDSIGGLPEDIVVAVFTHVRRGHVRRTLAGLVNAVVAANTVARDVHVVEVGRYPGHRRVAVIAVVAAVDMVRVLASRVDAVVAGDA